MKDLNLVFSEQGNIDNLINFFQNSSFHKDVTRIKINPVEHKCFLAIRNSTEEEEPCTLIGHEYDGSCDKEFDTMDLLFKEINPSKEDKLLNALEVFFDKNTKENKRKILIDG